MNILLLQWKMYGVGHFIICCLAFLQGISDILDTFSIKYLSSCYKTNVASLILTLWWVDVQDTDEQEHLEQSKVLADSPSATSFYNAYNRTVQRVRETHTHTHGNLSKMNILLAVISYPPKPTAHNCVLNKLKCVFSLQRAPHRAVSRRSIRPDTIKLNSTPTLTRRGR